MGKKRIKQYLMLLMVIGVVSIAAGGNGTFASFNAEVTNPGNTFASGTLFLHNTKNGGTTCTSESAQSATFNVNPGDGTNGNSCDTLFTVDLATQTSATADLALADAGSLPASDVKFEVSSCSVGTNQTATGSSVTFGTAPTCGDFYITVQERTDNNYNTNAFCAFGPGTLAVACATPDNTKTLSNSNAFANLQMNNGSNVATDATLDASGGANDTRYYTIRIDANPPGGDPNELQNRKLTFALSWKIDS